MNNFLSTLTIFGYHISYFKTSNAFQFLDRQIDYFLKVLKD
jgi:hypothetical protein